MTSFSFELYVPDLAAAKSVRLTATPEECADIADRLGLVAISRLVADVTATPIRKNKVLKVDGAVEASLTQSCVVSLQPFDADIATEFSEIFDRDAEELNLEEDEDSPWDSAADIPEFLEGDRLDLGDIAVQYLSLALDPFPRKPDADLMDSAAGEGVSLNEGERENPFAALKALQSDKEQG